MADEDDRRAAFIAAFVASFGPRAAAVAATQLQRAEQADVQAAWQKICDALAGSDGRVAED